MSEIVLRPVSEEPEIILPAWILEGQLSIEELAMLCVFSALSEGADQEAIAQWLDRPGCKAAIRSLKERGLLAMYANESGLVINLNLDLLRPTTPQS